MAQKSVVEPGVKVSDGTLTGTITAERLVVVPVKFLRDIELFLVSAYGPSASQVFFRFAQDFGERYLKQLGGGDMPPAEALKVMEGASKVAGWGDAKFSGDLVQGRTLKLEVEGCAFCPSVSEDLESRDDFVSGLAVGIAKTVFKRDYSVDHSDQPGEDGVKCTVVLTERQGKKRDDWKSAVYFPWLLESQ